MTIRHLDPFRRVTKQVDPHAGGPYDPITNPSARVCDGVPISPGGWMLAAANPKP